MSGGASKGSPAPATGGLAKNWKPLVVIAGVLFAAWVVVDAIKANLHSQVRETATVETQEVSAAAMQPVQPALNVCTAFSATRHDCVFDEEGSTGFGADTGGMHFCYATPFGPDQPSRRERWDEASKGWVNWPAEESTRNVSIQRFVANEGRGKVSQTYWLAKTGDSCEQ